MKQLFKRMSRLGLIVMLLLFYLDSICIAHKVSEVINSKNSSEEYAIIQLATGNLEISIDDNQFRSNASADQSLIVQTASPTVYRKQNFKNRDKSFWLTLDPFLIISALDKTTSAEVTEKMETLTGYLVLEERKIKKDAFLRRWAIKTPEGDKIPISSTFQFLESVMQPGILDGPVNLEGKWINKDSDKKLRFFMVERIIASDPTRLTPTVIFASPTTTLIDKDAISSATITAMNYTASNSLFDSVASITVSQSLLQQPLASASEATLKINNKFMSSDTSSMVLDDIASNSVLP